VRRQTVGDRSHRVLAHSECNIAPGITRPPPTRPWAVLAEKSAGSKSPSPFIAVSVTDSSPRSPMSVGTLGAIAFRVLPDATRVDTPFASAGKVGMSASQPDAIAAQRLLQLAPKLRKRLLVGREPGVPPASARWPLSSAPGNARAPPRDIEWRIKRPAKILFRRFYFVRPEG